jgi:DNA polymerase-1
MQNGQYDLHTLARLDIHPFMSFDTMGAQYAIDENSLKDLGLLATEYLGAEDYKDTLDKSKMNSAPLKDLAEYGARDADYTYRLTAVIGRRLRQDQLSYRLFRRLLMPATRTLADIEEVGLPIDHDKFMGRWIVCRDNIEATLERIYTFAGSKINPRSPSQLAKVLYRDLGFSVVELTATGSPSTSEAALMRLKDYDTDDGIINAIMEFRHWDGYESRYFVAWSELADKDWRLHAHFKPFHTVTGRLSCENPNLQQVPRDTFIRGLIGGRAGWKIVEADYSQIELRIAAHITQDKAMLRAFNTGRDIHMETAMAVTGKLESEITKEERKRAKSVNFGFLYGMGWKTYIDYAKVHYGIEVSEQEAKFVRERFFSTFRSLEGWHDRQRRKVKDNKFVLSPIGRKRRLWDIGSDNKMVAKEAERQAINSPVQSMASDMMLFSMVLLHPKLDPDKARIVSTVHDALIFEVREDCLDEVIPIIRETMENLPIEEVFDTLLTVPIEVEVKAGDYWSEGATVVT